MMPTRAQVSTVLLGACGAWLILLGIYFALLRPPLLGEDLRYIGITGEAAGSMTGFADWLAMVFIVLGGFSASTGVALGYLAIWILPSRPKGAGIVIAAVTSFGPVLMSVVNFALLSDFRWLLFAPAVMSVSGVIAYTLKR